MSTHVARPIARSPLTVPGNLLFAARAVWVIITAFGVAVFIATLPVYYTHTLSLHGNECCLTRHPTEWRAGLHQIGLSPQFYAWLTAASSVFLFVFYDTLADGLPWHIAVGKFSDPARFNLIAPWALWAWAVVIFGLVICWTKAARANPSLRLLSLKALSAEAS